MTDEVFPKIFRMEIPLPGNPLKAINSYLIKGDGRFLLIDTGMNREECKAAMQSSLRELQVDLARTDFFITHIHADHLGLALEMATPSSRIYFNKPEMEILNDETHWQQVIANAGKNGFPRDELKEMMTKHPGRRYSSRGELGAIDVQDGDVVRIGDYSLHCVATPGHTPGHLCLYEPKAKIFFSGDHILDTITPNIQVWAGQDDSLRSYLESLDKIDRYDIDLVLPGHREPFRDHRRRIAELKKHHEVRLKEVVSILKKGCQNAYQVASQMTWEIDCERWEDFPVMQKWFATGEAIAHLRHLRNRGQIMEDLNNGKILFCPEGE